MRALLTAIIFICIGTSFANAQEKVFEKIENVAHTDQLAWDRHIMKQVSKVPDSVWKNVPAGDHKVVVSFVIDKYGVVKDIKSVQDPGFGLAAIAERIVRNYKGTWTPASACGRNVNAYKKQPVIFRKTD